MPSPRYTVRLPQALDALVQARVRAGTPFAVLIREALAAYLADTPPTGYAPTGADSPPTSADSADRVQALGEQLAILRTRVEALEQGLTRRGQRDDTRAARPADRGAPSANSPPTGADTTRPDGHQPRTGRPRSALGARILAVLAQHPDGLSAEQIRVYLAAERPIGDILSGMKHTGAVQTVGQGRTLRYVLPPRDGA